jgi:hypothetical protein
MPYASFAIGLLFTFLLVTLSYLDNMQWFLKANPQIKRTPHLCFGKKAEGWAWRNVTTQINRQSYGCKD